MREIKRQVERDRLRVGYYGCHVDRRRHGPFRVAHSDCCMM